MNGCTKILLVLLLAVLLVGTVNGATLSFSQFGTNATVDGNPLGGGSGYNRIINASNTSITNVSTNADQLVAALAAATSGNVIYIPETAEINMTDRFKIDIPAGVTLASNRGLNGSAGGRIYQITTTGSWMFNLTNNSVRITGLRLDGGDYTRTDWDIQYTGAIRSYLGTGYEFDNNEIMGWRHAGIFISTQNATACAQGLLDTEIGSSIANIHHNYIHNNQHENLGYGVNIGNGSALIKANVFGYDRHAISAAGYYGSGYEASYNINIAPTNPNHVFDVHGYPSTGGIAGELFRLTYNTVLTPSSEAVHIRGNATNMVTVTLNNFRNYSVLANTVNQDGNENLTMVRNVIEGRYVAGAEVE